MRSFLKFRCAYMDKTCAIYAKIVEVNVLNKQRCLKFGAYGTNYGLVQTKRTIKRTNLSLGYF